MSEELIETFENGICTFTMNRPEARNAMSGPMMTALQEAVPRVAADRNVRAVVLTGAGGAFCAGGDVKGFASDADSGGKSEPLSLEERAQGLRSGMELSRILHEMPKPTLAVIPGPAAGAGLSLALACDLRFALDTAKITTAFSKIGLPGDYGGSYFLPYLVGAAKARELYFTADVISGQQAFELGLVNKVASASTFEAEAKAYAEHLASLATTAVGYMKKNLNAAQNGSLSDVFDLEATHMIRCFATEDHKEAAQAFVRKESPTFKGR
ncbi:MAG: enoyl-CoA hydratase [Gammaproteobacteria bacterium]|nr:enoyl-CoA hydratase [Gammaproteobacteria bacterium]